MPRLKIVSDVLEKEDWEKIMPGLTDGQKRLVKKLKEKENQPISYVECKRISGVSSFKTLINGWLSRVQRPYRLVEASMEGEISQGYKMCIVEQRTRRAALF